MWVELSSSWETNDGGLDCHAHGNWTEQGRPGRSCEELTELLPAHSKIPHGTCLNVEQIGGGRLSKKKPFFSPQDDFHMTVT